MRFSQSLRGDPNGVWVDPSAEEMADRALRIFAERFEMVLEDLASVDAPVLAEGWGLRPELLAPCLQVSEQAVFLVPTESFRKHQLVTLERSKRLGIPGLSDPERAQRNRIERDRILALNVVEEANRLALPVIHVDGTESESVVAERVEKQFRPFLPAWLY